MKKIDKFDAAIQQESATIRNLEAKLEKTLADKAEAERVHQDDAYLAETGNDPEARSKLEQVEETLFKAEKRTRSLEIALGKAKEKLDALRRDREEVFKAAKRAEYAQMAVALIHEDGEALESAVQAMSVVRESIGARLRKMEAVAMEANLDVTRVHGRVRQNLTHAVQQRAEFQAVWMSRENREIFRGPIGPLIETTLKMLIPELESQNGRRRA